MERKLPPILIWNGKRVMAESMMKDYGLASITYARINGKLKHGIDYIKLTDDSLAKFMSLNKEVLSEMYPRRGVLNKIRSTCYYIVTEKGIKKLQQSFPEKKLEDEIEWLMSNYFHVIPNDVNELKEVWDNLQETDNEVQFQEPFQSFRNFLRNNKRYEKHLATILTIAMKQFFDEFHVLTEATIEEYLKDVPPDDERRTIFLKLVYLYNFEFKRGETMKAKDLLAELSKGIQELNRMEESAKKQLQEIQAEKQSIKNQLKAILQEAE